MTTICLECGKSIESYFDFIEGIKTIRHLNNTPPNLRKLFSNNQEQATDSMTLEDGSTVHLVGDMVSYEDDDGKNIIQLDID